ncbi:hypothetical protein [Kitasatospora sp. NPDC048407]|uniref:hypothetical protein n=1 Tax=Kitasatospora sp. NPDC048407 TaxID=3364051 RepID=UPI0037133BC8
MLAVAVRIRAAGAGRGWGPAHRPLLTIYTNAVYHHQDNCSRLASLRDLALKAITN